MKRLAALLMAALIASAAVPTGAVAQSDSNSYAGTHLAFETESAAVVDYRLDGTTVVESVAVQSESQVESDSSLQLSGDLDAVTGVTGAALSVDASTETTTTISAESGATIRAHDNGHGTLVVAAGDEAQVVAANVSSSTTVAAESDDRVRVTTADGTEGTFIVVGEGSVAVNDDGNVSASLASDADLVFRAYADGASDDADATERMIANGTASAAVHVMQQGDATVADTVQYTGETSVEVTQTTEGEVSMAVERSSSEGRVVVTSVSEAVVDASGGVDVTVDGEAAARASSTSELRTAATSGSQAKYVVQGAASADAEVLVALDHFSTRDVTMQESDDGSTTESTTADSDDGSGGTATADDATDTTDGADDGDGGGGGVPGFGVGVALLALAGAALLARR